MPETKVEKQSAKWGDIVETEEEGPRETIDEHGIKTVVEFTTNEKGQKVKVTKIMRVYTQVTRRNPKVEARKKWKKFGDPDAQATTSYDNEITLTLSPSMYQEETKQKQVKTTGVVADNIVCKTCHKVGDHYTFKCPFKHVAEKAQEQVEEAQQATGPARYVAPGKRGVGLRGGESMDDRHGSRDRDEEDATVRVTNLSEDTKEEDLRDLFKPFGPISRVFLAKDKKNDTSRGFGFINFKFRADAAKAIETLQGYGYDHLILHLEWAKPSKA
eukprot:TRINITY_DN473_c0_g1_i1.p1 TRINITY_DN473_c0_g1~~TRINITY_DN473_c0_g1_i1.p1  ORF type:complete len:272 (-),score=98.37 TRINITY_DN473_c0_g1_i1:96-911(-)